MLLLMTVAFAVSLLGSMPMTGPLAVLVLDRALRGDSRAALASAAAGAAVEGVIALSVAWALPWFLKDLDLAMTWARVVGAGILVFVGGLLCIWPSITGGLRTDTNSSSLAAGVTATALNPTLFASWSVVVTAMQAHGMYTGGPARATALGVGVALGSLAWLAAVTRLTQRIGVHRVRNYQRPVIRGLGAVLASVGSVLLLRAALAH